MVFKSLFHTLVVALLVSSKVTRGQYAGTVAPADGSSTTSTFNGVMSSIPNWVGPTIGVPSDTACYRKTHLTKKCPPGYEFDNVATCWAQCPLEYPVECGMECIPQNEDCALEIISKVSSVATVAINAATTGVLGNVVKANAGLAQGVKCGQQLFGVLQSAVAYAEELQSNFPNTTQSQILSVLGKSDLVITDLPVAVCTCLGLPMPAGLKQSTDVAKIVTNIVKKIVSDGKSLLTPDGFISFIKQIGAGDSVTALAEQDLTALTASIQSQDSSSTCGITLKSLVNKIVASVQTIKQSAPTTAVDAIRLAVTSSDIFLIDIPAATSSCVGNTTTDGLSTRDSIRKTFDTIVDSVIGAASNSKGKPLSTAEYALKITDMGLDAIAMFDPTGIAALAAEYIQPICGPTSFIGEVDDGPLDEALGLTTMGKAFAGSYGTWTKAGDGLVNFTFESTDNKDVRVNIMSGGNKLTEVKVGKGKTVVWTGKIVDLQDKTLYLDRWRPGLFGLPGTGGGSLLMWIPHSSNGGHLELHAKINVS